MSSANSTLVIFAEILGASAFRFCSNLKKVEVDCAEVGTWFNSLSSIEQVVLGKATNHICDMDFDRSATEKIAELQSKIDRLEIENARYCKIIDKYIN